MGFLGNAPCIFKADALALFMAIVSSLIGSIIVFYSFGYISHYENQNEYYFMVVLFLGSMMGLVSRFAPYFPLCVLGAVRSLQLAPDRVLPGKGAYPEGRQGFPRDLRRSGRNADRFYHDLCAVRDFRP